MVACHDTTPWVNGPTKKVNLLRGPWRPHLRRPAAAYPVEPRNKQDRTWSIIDAVGQVAADRGLNHAQVALAWLAARPAATSVILGARTTTQLTDNLSAAEVDLTTTEIAHLDTVSTPVTGDYPYGPAGINQRHRAINATT